ncbi:hypothetical protein CU097_004322, partial [Rhizopus azygosporus]
MTSPQRQVLVKIVNDLESDSLICWAEDTASFFVNRQEDFVCKKYYSDSSKARIDQFNLRKLVPS